MGLVKKAKLAGAVLTLSGASLLGGCAVLGELAEDPVFMSQMQQQVAAIQQQKMSSGSGYRAPVYVPSPASYPASGYPAAGQQTASLARATAPAVPHCLTLRDRRLHNTCPYAVEATWCVARNGSTCSKYDNTWTIQSGNAYTVGDGHVYWNACRGANTIARRDGLTVVCNAQ